MAIARHELCRVESTSSPLFRYGITNETMPEKEDVNENGGFRSNVLVCE